MNVYQIPWFNPQFFNKWDIHKLLEKNSLTASLLPKSVLHPNAEALETLCSTFDTVYIKPFFPVDLMSTENKTISVRLFMKREHLGKEVCAVS